MHAVIGMNEGIEQGFAQGDFGVGANLEMEQALWHRGDGVVGHDAVRKITSALAETLDYPNFKNKIAETSSQVTKLDAYHEIWEVMYSEQE